MSEITLGNVKQNGIRIAKEKGIKFGRPKASLPPNASSIYLSYLCSEITCPTALENLNISRGTFFRNLKEYKENVVC